MQFHWGFPLLAGPEWLVDKDITWTVIACGLAVVFAIGFLLAAADANHEPKKALTGFTFLLVAALFWVFGLTPFVMLFSGLLTIVMGVAAAIFIVYCVLWHGIILNGYHAVMYLLHKD